MYADLNFLQSFLTYKQIKELVSTGSSFDVVVYDLVSTKSFNDLNSMFSKDYLVPFPTLSNGDYPYELKKAYCLLWIWNAHERLKKGERHVELERYENEAMSYVGKLIHGGIPEYRYLLKSDVLKTMESSSMSGLTLDEQTVLERRKRFNESYWSGIGWR